MHKSTRNDLQIDRDVSDELAWDTRVHAENVAVSVRDGIVTLTGLANTWPERHAAQEAARRVVGVLDVANDITVNLSPGSTRSDPAIAEAVGRALEWDTLIPHMNIHATVANGIVTLEGKVDVENQVDDAARCVRNLVGVRELRNLLEVQEKTAPPLSGHAVRAAIEQALARHVTRASHHVQLDVYRGKVTLQGDVPSWVERSVIEGAARGIPGVTTVESHIRLL